LFRNKKAEQIQKREQKQAAVQKQEMLHKQMVNTMDKYVKRIDKPSQVRFRPKRIITYLV
jgi:hypothetical protein